jgi:hypothetical protein
VRGRSALLRRLHPTAQRHLAEQHAHFHIRNAKLSQGIFNLPGDLVVREHIIGDTEHTAHSARQFFGCSLELGGADTAMQTNDARIDIDAQRVAFDADERT